MRELRLIAFVLLSMGSFQAKTQVIVEQLFAKMDIAPQYQLWDGNTTMLMGYTELLGAPIDLPSPTLVFNEGDSVELKLRNFSQAAPHTIHLHGLDVDQQNDGVPHLSFEVDHDSTRSYYFVAPHAGTYLYHCHVVSTLHVQAGMYGLIIVKPVSGGDSTWTGGHAYHKEYAWMMSEIDTAWHHDSIINHPHDPMAMQHEILDYNPQYFLVNGKSEQQLTDPISAAANEFVYLRLANIGYWGNRVILPEALNAKIVSSDGRPLPVEILSDTIDIMPGERYGVLLNPTTEFSSTAQIEYFDLNTQVVSNTQNIDVEVDGFLGNPELTKDDFEIYPNPTRGQFTVNLSALNAMSRDLKIFSVNGQLMLHQKLRSTTSLQMNLDSWQNGLYLVQIQTEKEIITKKLVIKN